MPTAYIYTRVSTDRQELSPEAQAEVCKEYYRDALAQRGFDLHPTVFSDIGQSAYHIDLSERRQGRELFKVLTRGDIIVAHKQDRLWRSVRDKENCMFYFKQTGIQTAILDMGIDTSTAPGKFASGIIALQSQWESDVKSERQKAAHRVRKKRLVPGRKNPPPGWKWDKIKEELVPDMNERKLLEMIYRWRIQKVRSIKSTCRWLAEEEIRRDNGTKYLADWVHKAHYSFVKGWPQEGYIQGFWRGEREDSELRDQYRLPPIDGKKCWIKKRPDHRASAADLRWLSEAYRVGTATSSSPVEKKSVPSGQET